MFIVCIHARTHGSFNRVLLIPWTHSCKRVLGNLVLLNEFQEHSPMEQSQQEQNRIERIENRHGMGTERIPKGYRTGTGTRVERQQNAFCQAFPVRFLLIGTVCFTL